MRFNLFPAEYADASWLAAVEGFLAAVGLGDLAVKDRGSSPSTARVRHTSMALLRLCELDRQYDFDYSDTGKRMALLPTPTLLALGQHAIALMAKPLLQRLIRGDEAAAVEAIIGHALRVRTLAQQANTTHVATALPELCALAQTAMLDAATWARLPMQIALSVLPESATGARARLRFRFAYAQHRLPGLNLNEPQRRQLVQVCLMAARDLEDPAVDALLVHRAAAPANTPHSGREA